MQALRAFRVRRSATASAGTLWILAVLGLLLSGAWPRAGQAQVDDVVPTAAEDVGEVTGETSGSEPGDATAGPDDAEGDADLRPDLEPARDVEIIQILGTEGEGFDMDTPESVTQFDASDLEALGAGSVVDLSRVTPNLEIVTGGGTQATFFIRGVGLSDFSSNAAGAVSVFQDDVSLNAPPLQIGQLFDVQQVEILRGPKGSGPFRNASAGAINVQSRRPTGDYSAQLRSSFGRYDADSGGALDAFIQDYEGALEFPIVGDLLSTRLAFRLRDADPYKTNGCGNAPAFAARTVRVGVAGGAAASICGERSTTAIPFNQVSTIPVGLPDAVGDEHNWAARGQLRYQPVMTDMDWLLNAHGSRLNEQSNLGQVIGTGFTPGIGGTSFGGVAGNRGPQLGYWEPDQKQEFEDLCQADPVTGGCTNPAAPEELARNLAENRPLDTRPFRGDFNRVGQTKLDTWGAFLRGDIDIAGMAFTTLSAYDAYDRSRDSDIDATPERLLETLDVDRAWQFWQELQLEGELDDHPLRWEVGGYYLMEHLDVDALTRVDFEVFNIRRQYSQKIWSLGFWGEFSWDFLDDFTLEGGIRYNWEKKDFDYSRSQIGPPQTTSQSASWSVPTGEITLRYRFNDEVAAYAGYSRGFKAGHFNALAARDVDQPPADPEFNDAFEVGLRGTWLDGRVTAGSSFFYYLYTDYQVFLFTDEPLSSPVLAILNADQAENYGAELDARIEPLLGWAPAELEGLVLIGRFGWLHGEFIDFNNVRNVQASNGDIVPITVDFTGNQLQNAPEYKVSATVEWTFDLERWGQVVPRYDFAWTDDAFFDPNNGLGTAGNLPDFAIGQAAFALHNLRLSYRTPGGNIEVAFWARNLTDQAYKTFAFDVSSFQQFVINFAGKPRTIGMDVSIAF